MNTSVLTHQYFPKACKSAIFQFQSEIGDELIVTEEDDYQRILAYVRFLLHKHPTKLMSVLYRIDIPEKAFLMATQSAPAGREVEAIAILMIAREIKKVEMREIHSGKQSDLDEDLRL